MTKPVALVISDKSMEPYVFGIANPVLLWPQSLSKYLSDAQMEAILAHELCHVRRRDNLAAAAHLLVESRFWFHPLVWWLGARMVDERERACDEEVLRLGVKPVVYADGILKICEFYLGSPIACAAGVTGSDLKKRMERIMRNHFGETLSTWRKLFLATVGVVALAVPVVAGLLTAPRLRGQAPAAIADRPKFDVVSVKENKSDTPGVGGIGLNRPGPRYVAVNVPLNVLLGQAYQPLLPYQRTDWPDWLSSTRYDIEAVAEGNPSRSQKILMLQSLLADRFKLVVHWENRQKACVCTRDGKKRQTRPPTRPAYGRREMQ